MQLSQCKVQTIALCYTLILFWEYSVVGQSKGTCKTFAFRKFEATVVSPYQMIHVSQENAKFVRSHVLTELESYGLTQTPTPEIFVDILVQLKLQRQATSGYSGSFDTGGYTSGFSIYEVGTLTIQLTDAANNNLLWEGSRTIPLWTRKEKKIKKRAERMIAKIFKDFDQHSLNN